MGKFIYINIIIVTLFLSLAAAQEKNDVIIEVQSAVDTSVITIGDRINYLIIIDRNINLRVAKPAEGLNLGMFEIKEYEFHEPQEIDGRIRERYDFTISVYDTGKFTIPPFPVAYFPEDTGNVYQIIEAPAIDIFVKSVMSGDEAGELKDVKQPINIPFEYMFWGSMAAVALLVGLAGYFGYLFWKRHRERGYFFTPPPPPVPAHETALAALNKLFATDLVERSEFKAFFSKLSEIIRIYIEGRYSVSALEETTSEIMRDLKIHLDNDALTDHLEQLLKVSDLVKFAKHIPAPQEIEGSKQQALEFVNETKIIFSIVENVETNGSGLNSEEQDLKETAEVSEKMLPPPSEK